MTPGMRARPLTFPVVYRRVERSEIIQGASWGVHGRGSKYKVVLDCGHTGYRDLSKGLPKSGRLNCIDCVMAILKERLKRKMSTSDEKKSTGFYGLVRAAVEAILAAVPEAKLSPDRAEAHSQDHAHVLECAYCGAVDIPRLVEYGYTLDHKLHRIFARTLEARGGNTGDFGETGDCYVFECQHCEGVFRLPEGMDIGWL